MGGEERQFDAVRGPGLIEDVGQVGLDGVLGNRGALGDLLARTARHDRAEDVDLRRVRPKALLCRRAASSFRKLGRTPEICSRPIQKWPALTL